MEAHRVQRRHPARSPSPLISPKFSGMTAPPDSPQAKAIGLFSSLFKILHKNASIELNQVQHTAEGTQVLHTFSVMLPDGTTRDLLVLLDSGAQVNLVHCGLLDPSHLRTSSQPVWPKVANGTRMIGGTEEVNLSLQFWQLHSPQVDSSATPTQIYDVFYEAHISG